MQLYIYSDESGVFDKKHYKYFIFGGYIFIGKKEKDDACRKYIAIENAIREELKISKDIELKASILNNRNKRRLSNVLNDYYKFSAIIKLSDVYENIFNDKKSKQRFMDFAYKLAVKNAITNISRINLEQITELHFYVDQHTTATNGKYELKESIQQEFTKGMYNSSLTFFNKPILSNVNIFSLDYCDSKTNTMIRASDIFANKIFHLMLCEKCDSLNEINNLYYKIVPQ